MWYFENLLNGISNILKLCWIFSLELKFITIVILFKIVKNRRVLQLYRARTHTKTSMNGLQTNHPELKEFIFTEPFEIVFYVSQLRWLECTFMHRINSVQNIVYRQRLQQIYRKICINDRSTLMMMTMVMVADALVKITKTTKFQKRQVFNRFIENSINLRMKTLNRHFRVVQKNFNVVWDAFQSCSMAENGKGSILSYARWFSLENIIKFNNKVVFFKLYIHFHNNKKLQNRGFQLSE